MQWTNKSAIASVLLLGAVACTPSGSPDAALLEIADRTLIRELMDRYGTVHDSGTVLNHLSYTGQIDGGVITGLGFALMEDNSLVDGKMMTANLGEFKMATVADVPKLTTVLMESPNGPIPYQGKAIAEIPNVPTAAAIANAIEDAVGVRLHDLPITSEKVYAALNGK